MTWRWRASSEILGHAYQLRDICLVSRERLGLREVGESLVVVPAVKLR
jgi:hypothetical protein